MTTTTITDGELRRAWNKCHRGIAELHDEVEAFTERVQRSESRLDSIEGKVDLIIDHLNISLNGHGV